MVPDLSANTCPICGRQLDETAGCLACAMTRALEDAAQASELAGGLPASDAPGFAQLADPVLPLQAGRFRLLRRIASGGMGAVYEAEDTTLGRVVALKMVRASSFASAEEKRRFELEACAAARLDHPHIVPVYEVGEIGGQPFLSMKLISGGTLAAKTNQGRLDAREAAALMARIARAVQHAHDKGVLHRDLKPSNVLIDEQGHPWLIDFGMARLSDASAGLTSDGSQIGTPSYMAPEQAAGRAQEVGQATDVWALGTMLYQMLTGELPYRGENHLAIMQAVINDPPPKFVPATKAEAGLAVILERCFEKDPAHRISDAGMLADDLERWLAGEPFSFAQKKRLWLRQWPVVAAALVLLAGAWLVMTKKQANAPVILDTFVLPPDEPASANFGRAVALHGRTLAVGAPLHEAGSVIMHEHENDRWKRKTVLTPAAGLAGDEFGRAIALHGDTLVVGAHREDSGARDSGAVVVFERKNDAWTQTQVLKATAPQANSGFGRAVAVHGDTLIVGSRLEDEKGVPDAGAAHVFVREAGRWRWQARLTAPQPGTAHLFGISVAVSGDTVLVGADGEGLLDVPRNFYDQRQPSAGSAYVFSRADGAWALQSLLAPAKGGGGCFGYSVALSGDTALIGAYRDNSGTTGIDSTPDLAARESGAAFVFVREGTRWTQQAYLKPHHTVAGSRFGFHVSLDGSMAVIGAYASGKPLAEAGAAYIFENKGGHWFQSAWLQPETPAAQAHFGIDTALSGRTIAIGTSGQEGAAVRGGRVWILKRD